MDRLEWITTKDPYVVPALYERGETLADGNTVTENAALGFGPLIIEGTRVALLQLVEQARALLVQDDVIQ